MVASVVDGWEVIEEKRDQKYQEDHYVMTMMVAKLLPADVSFKVEDGGEIMLLGGSRWCSGEVVFADCL